MTARAWLREQARLARRVSWLTTGLDLAAALGVVLAAGSLLERTGLFHALPELAYLPWLVAAGALGMVAWRRQRAHQAASPVGVGAAVERALGLREGGSVPATQRGHRSPGR